MARVQGAKGRSDGNSGYVRLLGDAQLGQLISRLHATVITAGRELEKIIQSSVTRIDDLDQFLEAEIMPDGVFLAHKSDLKRSQVLQFARAEPDFVIFKRRNNEQRCHVIELKDGDAFDTKKSAGERDSMHSFVEKNAQHIQFRVSVHVVAFNQDSRQVIYDGFKRMIPPSECMTGREFCGLLEIDYDEIVERRQQDADENFEYFMTELLSIERVREDIRRRLR